MNATQPTVELRSYLQENLPGYLDLLRRMVAVNSFTGNAAGVDALGRLTAELFAPLGFLAETIPPADARHGHHIMLERTGRPGPAGRPAPLIGLISHLDTVFPEAEEEANDFHYRVEGDRIYGPGTVDIKGGTVMIYMVLDGLRRFFPDVYEGITWRILLNAAEEVLARDFGELCRGRLGGALAALVFEGGDVEDGRFLMVSARKGMARYQITVEGRGAHAGAFHQGGANAIVQLADVIGIVAGFTDYDRDLTFNVGTVRGGTVMNRVPHQATAGVEMRAYDMAAFEEGVTNMLSLNEYCSVRSVEDGYPCHIDVQVEGRWTPWPPNDATIGLLDIWNEAARELGMKAVARQARGGLSDGNWLWDRVPTLDGLGPEGDNSHSSERSVDGGKDQEYVLASSFVPKAMLNIVAVTRLVHAAGSGTGGG
ncbi:MAG TPA: M20/M25/M40 family metallo-hydrolase [Promineifilum sp.]